MFHDEVTAATADYIIGPYLDVAVYRRPDPPSKRFRVEHTSWTNGGRSSGTYMVRVETRAEVLRRAQRLHRLHVRPWRWHYRRCRRDRW